MKTDNATPRPWRFGRITTGTAARVIVGADKQAVLEIPYRFGEVETRAGNQALLLCAVNAYDAHLALVEAARRVIDNVSAGPDDRGPRRLSVALEPSFAVVADALREALAAVEAAEKGE